MNNLLRRDIEQADIAALMASLLGIQWPVNSVGVLPDTDTTRPGYFAPRNGEEAIAQASLVNAKVSTASLLRDRDAYSELEWIGFNGTLSCEAR